MNLSGTRLILSHSETVPGNPGHLVTHTAVQEGLLDDNAFQSDNFSEIERRLARLVFSNEKACSLVADVRCHERCHLGYFKKVGLVRF